MDCIVIVPLTTHFKHISSPTKIKFVEGEPQLPSWITLYDNQLNTSRLYFGREGWGEGVVLYKIELDYSVHVYVFSIKY